MVFREGAVDIICQICCFSRCKPWIETRPLCTYSRSLSQPLCASIVRTVVDTHKEGYIRMSYYMRYSTCVWGSPRGGHRTFSFLGCMFLVIRLPSYVIGSTAGKASRPQLNVTDVQSLWSTNKRYADIAKGSYNTIHDTCGVL